MASTVWKGRITFGMVSIPVRMYKAARRERIRFHHVVRQAQEPSAAPDDLEVEEAEGDAAPGGPVERVHFMPVTGAAGAGGAGGAAGATGTAGAAGAFGASGAAAAPVDRPQLMKGYEIEKDRYVVFEPQEVAALRPRTSTELTIGEFVKLDEIDPVYFDASYYLAPDRGAEKPYAVLFNALQQSGYAAIGTLAMHGREHAAVIRPGKSGLILHTLFYAKEVRSNEEFRTDPGITGARELELAKQFISMLAEKFDPGKLQDSYEERLRQLIESRTPVGSAEEPEQKATVIDIAEALRKSLEMVRKPAKSETSKPPAAKRRRK